jgi:RNA polymerase sigma-70 factor (ECF subfamily)
MDSDSFARDYHGARQGDRAALDRLSRAFHGDLERFVRRQAGRDVLSVIEAEDLVQQTLAVLARRLSRFPAGLTERELLARVLRLARWEIGRVLERGARRVGAELLPQAPEPSAPTRSRGTVTRADDVRRLREILARMRPAYADVLRSRVLHGRSLAETAAELGLPPETVKKRLARARAEIAQLTAGWARAERNEG